MDKKEKLLALLRGRLSARKALGERAARTLANTSFAYTMHLYEFAKEKLVSILNSSPRKNETEGIFVGIFLRMYLWMETLVALNRSSYIQGVAVAFRSLFELFLDLKILADDKTGECYERYIAFSEIEMFNAGQKKVNFYERYFPEKTDKYLIQKQFIMDPGKIKKITSNLMRFWPRDDIGDLGKIKHWSSKNVRERAAQFGTEYELIYIEYYYQLNQIVHGSGLEFFRRLNKEHFEYYYAFCHEAAQSIFIEAMKIVAKQMGLDKAWEHEGFYKKLGELKNENMLDFIANIIKELENQENMP
jgi:hypothetical protein